MAVPVLLRGIGVDRFAVLSIAWIVLGYLGVFDLGVGRALTKLAAEKIGGAEEAAIAPLAWTSLFLLFFLGAFGGLFTGAISPWLIHKALKVPATLQTETLRGFFLLAASIPIVTVTSGLRGLLEALQHFRILTLIRVPLSIFSFVGPMLVLPFSHSLVAIFGVLVAGRLIGCVAHWIACSRAVPAFRQNFILEGRLAPALIALGSWMTVTSLLGPALMYVDRFIIGGLLSLTAVAYYTAPFDMLSRLWLIPWALIGVLFPAFAATLKNHPENAGLLFVRGVKYVFMATFPIILLVVTLSPEILRIWLGAAFEQNSAQVLRWLAGGLFVSCLAQVPFTLIQSAGRPDVTGMLGMVEFPFYLAAVWLMTAHFGIVGAAMAWAGRATAEASFLFFYTGRLLPRLPGFIPRIAGLSAGGLIVLYLASLLRGEWIKAGFLVIALPAFGLMSWHRALRPSERGFFMRGISRSSDEIRAR